MPLFDPNNAKSLEAPTLYRLAQRLAECESWQELAGATGDAVAALGKVKICQQTEAWDSPGGPISIDQLQFMLAQADIAPAQEEEHEARRAVGDPEGKCPRQRGSIEIRIIRWVLPWELADYGEEDLYLWFCDRVAGITSELHLRADATGLPLLRSVRRQGRPLWNSPDQTEAQGLHLWAELVVSWGSPDEDEQ